ncbi:threonine/serine exporter family protein [Nocardioides dongxiaopingii]|uniref:threonine/serine ThrE exporter family protein n=1 Tax=Nocardioides sp. S-1144 TaxID=2582905 RepID=UPI0011659A83|nr:threonine/serine exporter family protein [Nocardioides sp. S-1144]QDH11058.1 threonine/serine exporter family protein [Nocardioides sp. S-1144]
MVEPELPATQLIPLPNRLALTLDFCLRLGEILLSSGAGAADVTVTMLSVARALGAADAEADITFTLLTMSHQTSPDEAPLIARRQVAQRVTDYQDLTNVDHLVRGVVAGRIGLREGRAELNRITSTGHDRHRWAVTAGWGVMSAGIAILLGGGPVVVVVAALAALLIDRLQLRIARRRLPTFYAQVAGGGTAALVAVAARVLDERFDLGLDVSFVITANIVVLLAGVGFMGAIQDALTGFYITAGARITEAVLSTCGIIAGVSGGLSVASAFGVDLPTVEPGATGIQGIGMAAVGGAIGAAAFAFSSYSPNRVLAPIAVVAAIAVTISATVEEPGLGRTWAVGVAAFFVGLVGYAVAKRLRVPPLIVVVSCVVPMLPGIAIYRGLSLLGEGSRRDTSLGLVAIIGAASVALAIAAGVILGEYLAQPLGREVRRVEDRLVGPRLVGPSSLLGRRAGRAIDRRTRRRTEGARDEPAPGPTRRTPPQR